MTTFQDPQPQSRRAVRQGERGDSAEQPGFEQPGFAQQAGFTGQADVDGQANFTGQPSFPGQSAGPQFYADAQAARDMWDTTARRAAQLPPAAPRQDASSTATGRRAAAGQPAPTAEPLNYSTQQTQSQQPGQPPQNQQPGQQAPLPEVPSRRSRAAQVPDAAPQPPTQALPQAGQPVYRVRDFSPEGRRPASPEQQPSWSVQAPPSDLDYRTELRSAYSPVPQDAPPPVYQVPPGMAAAPQPVSPPASAPPPISELPVEQTLSRRELRAMQQAEQGVAELQYPGAAPTAYPPQYSQVPAAPFANAAPSLTPAAYSAPPEPATNTALTDAIAEFDSLAGVQLAPAQPATPAQQVPAQQLNPAQQAPDQQPPAQQVAPGKRSAAAQDAGQASTGWTPPVGHWSTQADLDDGVPETTIGRRIGSGSTATNALVLPTIPAGSDIRGPLTGTGEIMLTGSIDLPRSLSSTGASARLEHGGIDEFFDLHDAEAVSTDSSPVRAIRAVSTHTSGHGVTHTQKPKGTRALTALLIAASSMAVVVAGLLVAAFAFNVF